ncbi:hypothetical protein BZG36_04893 [Bifiguratus adelaidae]|uniref:Chromatin modification-related protein EAF7 n=1 Tax=Bifiguratus adelaidae TaxID=1938954 RepID=A0A261XUE7_9FUNG|nr:hypothetical protein BZG36_04893 [Bifiguratus adelaidae]
MPEIKFWFPQEPTHTEHGHTMEPLKGHSDWDTKTEIVLLRALARNKPVGVHKHFRMLNIYNTVNSLSSSYYTLSELRSQIAKYYDVDAMEEMEETSSEDEDGSLSPKSANNGTSTQTSTNLSPESLKALENRLRKRLFDPSQFHEFTLPLDEYEQLISEHRQDDHSSRQNSPSPPASRRPRTGSGSTTGRNKEASPDSRMSASGSASEGEEDEKKPSKTTRRAQSKASRSKVTPEPTDKGEEKHISTRRTRGGSSKEKEREKEKEKESAVTRGRKLRKK